MKAIRFTDNTKELFHWFGVGQSWTARQLAALLGISTSNMQRRLSQFTRSSMLTSSPPIAGVLGDAEREYYVTPGNAKRLQEAAPWLEIRPAKTRKQTSIPHHRLVNDFWVAFHTALKQQEYYSYTFLPHYSYDNNDAEAPSAIQVPNVRSRTHEDMGIIADFTLVVACNQGATLFFGEADIGSEIIKSSVKRRLTLERKLEAYCALQDSGETSRFSELFQQDFSGFRVLIICPDGRIRNIRKICQDMGSTEFIWLTGIRQVNSNSILGPVWMTGDSNSQKRRLLKHSGG